jgi:predicted HicB family RNase H-like nuclease
MSAADPRGNRRALGFTESFMLKIHPDMAEHIKARAEQEYISTSEYVRRLIVEDMRRSNGEGET